MSRNSSGTYSLPAGNPVVTGTVISSVWANTTLADIATTLTDSVSRSGQGSMTGQLFLSDGAIGAPAMSWGTETTSGFYRAGSGDFRYSLSAVDKLQLTTNGLKGPDGAVGTPSWSFISDPDTGLYSVGANSIGITAGGARRMSVSTTQVYATVPFQPDDGAVGTPIYSFNSDPDTGMYRAGANLIALAAGGAQVFRSDGSVTLLYGQLQAITDGLLGTPTYSFNSDPDTGFWRAGSGETRVSSNGVLAFLFNASSRNYSGAPQFTVESGTVSLPGYAFEVDPDTGMRRIGADNGSLVAGGVDVLTWTASSVSTPNATVIGVLNSTGIQINAQSTATATAGAAALPANPQGFITISINGTSRKVPYYQT